MFDKFLDWTFPQGIGRKFIIAMTVIGIAAWRVPETSLWENSAFLVLGFYFGVIASNGVKPVQ